MRHKLHDRMASPEEENTADHEGGPRYVMFQSQQMPNLIPDPKDRVTGSKAQEKHNSQNSLEYGTRTTAK